MKSAMGRRVEYNHLSSDGSLRVAIESLQYTINQNHQVPLDMLLSILQNCTRKKDLTVGREVFTTISNTNCLSNSRVGCQLIRMFDSCGSIAEAFEVFNGLPVKNFYTWTAIISALAHHGLGEQALVLYKQMQTSKEKSPYAVVAALKACSSIGALDQGKLIHSDAIRDYLESDRFIGSALVDMYCKCGSIDDARHVFNGLALKDVVTWSAMAAGFAQQGYALESLQLCGKMHQEGLEPNAVTFVSILKSCVCLKLLDQGMLIHADLIRRSIWDNLIIGNVLIDMYAKCGNLEDALKTFRVLPVKDVVSWNAIIAGFLDHEYFDKAMNLFVEMQDEGVVLNKPLVLCLLKSFGSIADHHYVKSLHSLAVCQLGGIDKFIANTLIDVYAKCKSIMDARNVFNGLQKPDAVSWNAMIAGYAEYQLGDEAFCLFEQMRKEGKQPDKVTFLSILKACSCTSALIEGRLIHGEIIRRQEETDVFIGSALVDMYAKCGSVGEASNVFDHLSTRNIVSWNVLISGYVDCGFFPEALKLFQKMRREGLEPSVITCLSTLRACSALGSHKHGSLVHFDVIIQGFEEDTTIGNCLIDIYAMHGNLQDAHKVLDMMSVQNVISWSTLISGYAEQGYGEKALQLFIIMQHYGIEPNNVTFLCALKACSAISAMEEGKLVHARIVKQAMEEDLCIGSTLVDMYAKCNSLRDAHSVFDELPERNVISWSALIGGYAEHGKGADALDLYKEMQFEGVVPNNITCLSVIKACSSLAALHDAKVIHKDTIERAFELSPSIGSTLVDMYVKCGSLDDALRIFHCLVVKDVVTWNSIIGGYADHGDYPNAYCYFMNMQYEGIRPDSITFICLLYACSHVGLVTEGFCFFNSMTNEYKLEPRIKHFVCMIDLLGRAGLLEKAETLVSKLPCESNSAAFLSLLGSCAKYRDAEIGHRAFDNLAKFDSKITSRYILLSNILAAASVEDFIEMDELELASIDSGDPGLGMSH